MKLNCPLCSDKFKAMATFEDHWQTVHKKNKNEIELKCEYCKETFPSANACSKTY